LLEPRLLISFWSKRHRYEWQHHVSRLRGAVSLTELAQAWIRDHTQTFESSTIAAAAAGKLCDLFQEMGALDEAVLLAQAAFFIWERNNVVDSPDMVECLLALGKVQYSRDEMDKATVSYERARAIAERAYSSNSSEMADVFWALSLFFLEGKRDYAKASEYVEKCYAIRSSSTPPGYLGMANCIENRAVILMQENRPADYVGLLETALELFEKAPLRAS